jgi:hypothetical protein
MRDDEQDALFDVEVTPVRAPARKVADNGKPRWSKYQVKHRVKCDDCMLLLAQTNGQGAASRQARWRRKVGGSDLLLCYAHAALRRTADGLAPL